MTDAKVRIVAENATQAGIRSVETSLKGLERSGRTLGSVFKFAFSGWVATQALRPIKEIFELTGKRNPEFAQSLKEVKEATASLFDGSAGVPAATQSLRELSGVLADPTTKAAAQQLSSSLLQLGAAAMKGAGQFFAGWQLILNGPAQKSMQIDARIEQAQELERAVRKQLELMNPNATVAREATERGLQDLIKRRTALEKEYWAAIDEEGKAARTQQQQAATAQQSEGAALRAKLLEQHRQQVDADQRLTQTSTEAQVESWNKFYAALQRLRADNAISDGQYLARYNEQLDDVLSEVTVSATPRKLDTFESFAADAKNTADAFDPLKDSAERAAWGMQSTFEDFFFDPMDQGFKGLLKGFADTVRRMIAEAAAAKLAESLFGSSGGGGGIFGTILGGIFGSLGGGGISGSTSFGGGGFGPANVYGFANGGSFKVGGHGGTDSQLVRFRATPGEKVSITRPDRAASGGVTIAPVYNIDARGATTDLVRALPGILARNNAALKSDIVTGIRRGKYAI